MFGRVRASFKLSTKEEGYGLGHGSRDLTRVRGTIEWFAERTNDLEDVAQRMRELDAERIQKEQKEIASITEQSAKGTSELERALWRLRALLNQLEEAGGQSEEEASGPVAHGMSPEALLRYNRLAAMYGLD